MNRFTLLIACLFAASTAFLVAGASLADTPVVSKAWLGEQIFHDVSLSRDGTQACASCHDEQRAFIDARVNVSSAHSDLPGAVSTGQDGKALGDINTPGIAYAALTPAFHFEPQEGVYVGGLFLDGRAHDVVDQATQPFLNPVEMQTTEQAVVAKVQQRYGEQFRALYGADIFTDSALAFKAVADALASFERTPRFATFDSKFDRVLHGEDSFTPQEELGKDAFIEEDKGNCAACHPVPELNSAKTDSLFTDFTYDNLGVPINNAVRKVNGKGMDYRDPGLYGNPKVDDPALKGAFRVSSLRNVAVTAPYMHNGVFKDLATVIEFYNTRDVSGALNPETGEPWASPETPETMNSEELGDLGLSNDEIKALVAFLHTLTDKRYEP